jgi:hypothetical protein
MTKKVVLIVIGAVLLLCGLGCAVPGALLTAVTGSDNTLVSGFHDVGTPTPALVSETARISDTSPTAGIDVGETTLRVSVRSSDEIFLGVAAASDVDRYLEAVEYDEIRDLEISPYRVDTIRRDGLSVVAPPTEETFWLAEATGTAPNLEWDLQDGDYRFVLMNADGSPGVQGEAQFGVTVAGLFGIGVGWLMATGLVAVVGLVLLIVGVSTRGRPHVDPAPGPPQP